VCDVWYFQPREQFLSRNISLMADISPEFLFPPFTFFRLNLGRNVVLSTCHPALSHSGKSERRAAIIFDWDDTICPSTLIDSLSRSGIHNKSQLPSTKQRTLEAIEESTIRLVKNASRLGGPVILITNSEDGWVKFR